MPHTGTRKSAAQRQAGQEAVERGAVPTSKAKEEAKKARDRAAEKSVVQLRLRGEESVDLEYSMRVLALGSTSEALREGLRLLHREASEVEAAQNIEAFYGGEQAPLPDGVVPAQEADLTAADNSQW